MAKIDIDTTCPFCGRHATVSVDAGHYKKWKNGTRIQDALPELDADQREALVSGICPPCWDKMFYGE